jgi:hypothetical protein
VWIWITIALAVVLLCAAIFVSLLRVAASWGRDAIELRQHGVEVTGTVVEKRSYNTRRSASTHIRYEYTDQFGKRHRSRRNLVTREAWERHAEGGPIAVVYSQRRPHVSLPRYLLDFGGTAEGPHDGGG